MYGNDLMEFAVQDVQTTTNKIINNFCFMHDIDETDFRKEVAAFTANEGSFILQSGECSSKIMLDAVWHVIATKSEGYKFAILAGSMMAIAPSLPFSVMKSYAPNLRSVFRRTPYFAKFLPVADIECHDTNGIVSLDIKAQRPGYGSSLQIASYFSFLIRMARAQTSKPFFALKLELENKFVTCAKLAEFMGCDIEIGATNSIHFDKSAALTPFFGANLIKWRQTENELKYQSIDNKKSPLHRQVYNILMETLPRGNGAVAPVAKQMGITQRTLQRRLKKDGVSYRHILNEARFWLSTKFLDQGKMSKTEIAYRLGYRDPNSFYRVYKAWKKAQFD